MRVTEYIHEALSGDQGSSISRCRMPMSNTEMCRCSGNELGIDSDSILAQLKREGVLETDAEACWETKEWQQRKEEHSNERTVGCTSGQEKSGRIQ